MIPDLNLLKSQFKKFNEAYFNNKLPIPNFSYNCPSDEFGHFELDKTVKVSGSKVLYYGIPCGELSISNKYSRSVKDIQTTLLHEMVHMYVYFVLKKAPRYSIGADKERYLHGREFMAKANELRQYGWNVTAKEYMKDTDIKNDGSVNTSDTWSENGVEQNYGELALMYKEIMQLNAYLDQLGAQKINESALINESDHNFDAERILGRVSDYIETAIICKTKNNKDGYDKMVSMAKEELGFFGNYFNFTQCLAIFLNRNCLEPEILSNFGVLGRIDKSRLKRYMENYENQ